MQLQQAQRSSTGGVHSMPAGAALGNNVAATSVAGANAQQQQQQQQQPAQHQAQINQHYLHQQVNPALNVAQMYVAPPPQQKKQEKKILEIIDPKTGVNILENYNSKKPSATAGSAPLTVDAQLSGQPAGAITQLDAHDATAAAVHTPTVAPGVRTEHDAYNIEQRELLNDVPQSQHTPVVSAIADGPSVEIPPKQSKNIKRK